MTENSNSEDQEWKAKREKKKKKREKREKEETPLGNCDAVEDEALQGLCELTAR